MWIVAKVKKKEINFFKNDLIKKSGQDIKFYIPKIEYYQNIKNKKKRLEKLALENYIFCYNINFRNSIFVNKLKFIKGLEYFLGGSHQSQHEIVKFIKYCKCSENNAGYLTQSFLNNCITKKAKFISGPFTNMIFEIIKKQKNKLKIIVGNVAVTVSSNSNYLYRPA